jgi:hypothetical protein
MTDNATETQASSTSQPVATVAHTSSVGVKTIFAAASNAAGEAAGQSNSIPSEPQESSSSDASVASDSVWYLAPGIPGTGPKPEGYIESKYGSVLEQAQGYNNLRKKLGAFTGAPETYDLDMSKVDEKYHDVKLDVNDSNVKSFLDLAKEANMSQEYVHKFLKYKLDMDLTRVEQENKLLNDYTESEVKKLGPNAKERLDILQTWWKQNFPEYPVDKMQSLAHGADFVEMLESIKSKFKFNPVPVDNAPLPSMTRDEARAMLNDPKYRSDKEYRQKVDAIYSKFV